MSALSTWWSIDSVLVVVKRAIQIVVRETDYRLLCSHREIHAVGCAKHRNRIARRCAREAGPPAERLAVTDLSDAQIIQESRDMPERFEVIFDRHYPAVVRFASGRIGSLDAPDVASDTFVRAFGRRSRFDLSKNSALPWLFGIAANVVRERRRKAGRGARAYSKVSPDRSVYPFEVDAVQRLDAGMRADELSAALRALSEDEYQVLMLAAMEDMSYQEIADALNVPIGTVRSRLFRARRRMREQLKGEGSIPGDLHVELRST